MPKEGGIDFIVKYLYDNRNTIYKIEHPFEKYDSRSTFKKNEKIFFSQKPFFSPPLAWLFEIVLNIAWCIRINEKYRICFIWSEEGPFDVQIVDYH